MRNSIVLAVVAVSLALAGCDDSLAPQRRPVPEEPSEVTLFEFRDSDLRDPSAFDAIIGQAVRTDQTSEWDYLFALRASGAAELRPRNVVLGGGSVAGLQVVEQEFGQLDQAPENGYRTGSAVAVSEGDVLAGRSRQDPSLAQLGCNYFLKMEILSVDPAAGTLTFRHLINPNCNQRNLVPGSTEGG